MIFADRDEAGQLLAARMRRFKARRPVVLALPRGGVPVAFAIARALGAPLGLVVVRKIGAPDQPELAIGAVADGPAPELVTDARLMARLGVSAEWLREAEGRALRELERRRAVYLAEQPPIDPRGRVVILVDDGIATGATMRAALRSVRRQGASRLIVAVPVAAPRALADLASEVDEMVCLHVPEDFLAVGESYRQFPQLADQEVIDLLRQAAVFAPIESAPPVPRPH